MLGACEAKECLSREHPSFIDFCSLSRRGEINLNAVPESLWRTFWPESVNAVTAQRAQGVWISQNNPAERVAPGIISIPSELYARLGGESYIVKVWGQLFSISVRVQIRRSRLVSIEQRIIE